MINLTRLKTQPRKNSLKFDKFIRPTLITITAPTCSGKTYLLDLMTKQNQYSKKQFEPLVARVVSTTTRAARYGEVEGVDYNFLTMEESLQMEADGKFAELVNFRGTRYGVTHEEMTAKIAGDLAPVVILEPTGIEIYEKYCRKHNWDIFKIYVSVLEGKRIQRLNDRTAIDVRNAITNVCRSDTSMSDLIVNINAFEAAEKLINVHTDRLLSITGNERRWQSTNSWDAIIPGDNAAQAIKDIALAIKWRNRRVTPHVGVCL